jgi:hypothetical protein
MMGEQLKTSRVPLLVWLLLLLPLMAQFAPLTRAHEKNSGPANGGIIRLEDDNGIRVISGDVELYFNASNGGEITEYFDLLIDPSRSRNLASLGWKPYYNLLPLFSSMFYNPYIGEVLSTGGDLNATVKSVANASEYVILQTSSKIMSLSGKVAKDAYGNVIYINSTWVLRSNGLVSVERTFFAPRYAIVPSRWRWYPFYLTRTAGFDANGTFLAFNTTLSNTSVVNETTYRNIFNLFSILPNDTSCVSGVGLPFSNVSIGGDGAHNILIAYKYDELMSANEWRTDNYYSMRDNITESGAVHEFSNTVNVSTHTYHIVVNFTHQSMDEDLVQNFTRYYAENPSVALLMNCSVTTNQDAYRIGDYFAFYGSGSSYYNLTRINPRLNVRDSTGRVVYQRDYGWANVIAGQTFNGTLLTGTIPPYAVPGDYTVLLEICSAHGIALASSSKMITITSS